MAALRALLNVPADDDVAIDRATAASPDAIVLDLGWSLHPSRRAAARTRLPGRIARLAARVTPTYVRVGGSDATDDLNAAVSGSIAGLIVPGVASAGTMRTLDAQLTDIERERGLPAGSTQVIALLDTGPGLWWAREIAQASQRVSAVVLGMGDLAFDVLGTSEEIPYFTGPMPRFGAPTYNLSRLPFVATAAGVPALGLLATTVAPGHLDKGHLGEAVRLAWEFGFKGALTTHDDAVAICQTGFEVPDDVVERARSVVMAPERYSPSGVRQARAAIAAARRW